MLKMKETINVLQQNMKGVTTKINQLKENYEKAQVVYDEKLRRVEKEEEELLELELMQTADNLAAAKTEIAKIEMEKEGMVKQFDQMSITYQKQLSSIKKDKSALESKVLNLKVSLDNALRQKQASNVLASKLRKNIEAKVAELGSVRSNFLKLEEANEKLKEINDESKKKEKNHACAVNSLSEEVSLVKIECIALSDKCRKKDIISTKLRNTLVQVESKLNVAEKLLKQGVTDWEATLHAKETQLITAENKLLEKDVEIEKPGGKHCANVKKLSRELKEKNLKISFLHKHSAKLEEELKNTLHSLSKAKECTSRQNEILKSQHVAAEQMERKLTAMKKKMSSFETKLSSSTNEKSNITQQLNELECEKNSKQATAELRSFDDDRTRNSKELGGEIEHIQSTLSSEREEMLQREILK